MTEQTAVAAFQEKFIKEVADKGIEHAFTWIAGSYLELATARLQDDITRAMGEHAKDPANKDGLVLFLTGRLAENSTRLANRSTGAGTNLLLDADVAVTAQRLEKFSKGSRFDEWEAFCARIRESNAQQS